MTTSKTSPTDDGFDEASLRQEFLSYQFGFAPFSDHYSVVASFVRKKVLEAVAAQVGRNPKGQDAEERLGAEHEHAVAEGDAPNPSPLEKLHDIANGDRVGCLCPADARELVAEFERLKAENEHLYLRLGSLGLNPKMDTDVADICARLGAMGSFGHKSWPTHYINPDGKDAAAVIERLNAQVQALSRTTGEEVGSEDGR